MQVVCAKAHHPASAQPLPNGLRHSEVICTPTLDDPPFLAQLVEDQRSVLEHGVSGAIAPRYAE